MTGKQPTHSTVPQPESGLSRAAGSIVIGMAPLAGHLQYGVGALCLCTFLAPIFMEIGWRAPAAVVYIYSVLCHQLPDHSYFLFGPSFIPQTPELIAGGMQAGASLLIERSFIGNEDIWLEGRTLPARRGHLFLGLSGGSQLHPRAQPRKAAVLKIFILLTIPMAIDGLTQLIGWRESNWWLRSVTGALFGAAAVFLVYPYVEDAMQDVLDTELRRRAAPMPAPEPDRAG